MGAVTARIPVYWRQPDSGAPAKGYWDQTLLDDILAEDAWSPVSGWAYHEAIFGELLEAGGGIVVVPGATSHPEAVAEELEMLDWAVVIITSDEERRFPVERIRGPHRRIWLQYPKLTDEADAFLPVGYAPGTREEALDLRNPDWPRTWLWTFDGQVTTERRRAMEAALRRTPGGHLAITDGFAKGRPHQRYMADLAAAMFAPAPGGPISPDSFRVWEALEAGAIPITDAPRWWGHVFRDPGPPWPMVERWHGVRKTIRDHQQLGFGAARAGSWYLGQKRALTYRLRDDVRSASGRPLPLVGGLDELLTVLITTSPIASHPSTGILDRTIASIDAAGLDRCEILLLVDGVRFEQAHYADAYNRYVERILADALAGPLGGRRARVLPIVHGTHEHQARMVRGALDLVQTPLVLFAEHDTPLTGPIPWENVTAPIIDGFADVVRLYHEKVVPEAHEWLFDGEVAHRASNFLATRQWSQRPHVASTSYYRRIMADHFDPEERWMIEDRMHSVAQSWPEEHRLLVYADPAPGLGIQRSDHSDGRGTDPKWTDR